ncbi:MAG: hypothetical protein BGP12_15845 [Rhodospirillales bacterium 70-18]|nr:hypothetical protein [Rhodospirillales bacterium]OJY64019.1 MAG: hypothetical protein BGP12_15845 [Rhodospirillales bacterium 70-18]
MIARRRVGRRLLDLVLLPFALVLVVLEDLVWAGARALLRQAARLPPVRVAEAGLGRLPGWAALPLFLVPELLGRVGEVWAVALLVGGQVTAAALVYVVVRLLATLLAVFIYHACEAALLRIGWFALVVGWVRAIRDWALCLLRPWRERVRTAMRAAPGGFSRRLGALRRRLARRLVPRA